MWAKAEKSEYSGSIFTHCFNILPSLILQYFLNFKVTGRFGHEERFLL